jgi:uncharacterized protein YcfJ
MIDKIEIYNRKEVANRLNNFDVFVLDKDQKVVWQAHSDTYPDPSITLDIDKDVIGRYVKVQLTGLNYLSLAEVKVFGYELTNQSSTSGVDKASEPEDYNINFVKPIQLPTKDEPEVMSNVALNKPASQSSTGVDGVASRAVDGNINGEYAGNSVTHTNAEEKAYWQVDLQSNHMIHKIEIYNRKEAANRLINFDVFVLDENQKVVWSYYRNEYPNPSMTLDIANGVKGRFVKVQLRGKNYLSLAEVKVIGYPLTN